MLEPHGLVLKAGVWYVCARTGPCERPAGAFRVYRVDRFTSVEAVASGAAITSDAGATSASAVASTTAVASVGPVTSGEPVTPAAAVASGEPLTFEASGAPGPSGSRWASGAEHFERDPEFDLPAFWEERAAEFARSILRTTVRLRVSPAGARALPAAVPPADSVREALAAAEGPGEDGWVTLSLSVESEEVAYGQLLAMGPEAEVLGPGALRERFARAARRAARLYEEPRDAGAGE